MSSRIPDGFAEISNTTTVISSISKIADDSGLRCGGNFEPGSLAAFRRVAARFRSGGWRLSHPDPFNSRRAALWIARNFDVVFFFFLDLNRDVII